MATALNAFRAGRARQGFSIIEVLLVIALIGILVALATPTYRAWQDRATTREAAVQLARAVDRARIDAKRTGAPVTLSTTAAAGAFVIEGVSSALPAIVELASTSSVTFVPPFGTQGESEVVFVVRSRRDATVEQTVRVVGVLGKVVIE